MFKIIITIICLLFTNLAYSAEVEFNDESKSIRELKDNIEVLDKDRESVISKIKDFNPSENLKKYFKKNLNEDELNELSIIIDQYIFKKNELESIFIDKSKLLEDVSDIKVLLLEEKKQFYKNILIFINSDYYDEYLEYIKWDTVLYNERKDLESNIIRKNEIISNKIEILEKKITRHKTYLEDSLRVLVKEKIDSKIESLNKVESFYTLEKEKKIEILNKTVETIKIKIIELEKNLENQSQDSIYRNNLFKKIDIYNIVLESLNQYIDKIK